MDDLVDNPLPALPTPDVPLLDVPMLDVLARPIPHGQNASASRPMSRATPPLDRPARLRLVEPPRRRDRRMKHPERRPRR
jgi:hypothetical protein